MWIDMFGFAAEYFFFNFPLVNPLLGESRVVVS
jgi:hypothetical protein